MNIRLVPQSALIKSYQNQTPALQSEPRSNSRSAFIVSEGNSSSETLYAITSHQKTSLYENVAQQTTQPANISGETKAELLPRIDYYV